MRFINTRQDGEFVRGSQAILKGLSKDGGLYVPEKFPWVDIEEMVGFGYQELAAHILNLFLGDEDLNIGVCVKAAYDDKFKTQEIVPVVPAGGFYFVELHHGKTLAFKDIALSILPYLLKEAQRSNRQDGDVVILTATSGDTGKAALAGFAGVPGVKIIVFYPENGISDIQKLQMVSQVGENVCVIGVKGNFDDAQAGVKRIFVDQAFNQRAKQGGYSLSSANSINIGRLVPQIVYYLSSYTKLRQRGIIPKGGQVDVVVPTGNFGNILAAYYAKQMRVPIRRLICASNSNNVLYDFITSGVYDLKQRRVQQTNSPSMDILISSNLERLIFELVERDPNEVRQIYQELKHERRFQLPALAFQRLQENFIAAWATEAETNHIIDEFYRKEGYLLDTHTAVAVKAAQTYRDNEVPMLIAATASPFKFPHAVARAIGLSVDGNGIKVNEAIANKIGVELPLEIQELAKVAVLHTKVCKPEEMPSFINDFLGI